jgi:hypothetical protein
MEVHVMDTNPSEDPATEHSQWPTAPMLAYGTFGSRTPAGRRYHLRAGIALAVMAVCMFGGALARSVVPQARPELLAAIAPGAGFLYIAWEFRRYLASLDELARRIQLESIAWTYLTGLAIAMLLGGFGVIYGWRINAGWFIMLEPVRSAWLYCVARRYQ